MIIVAWESTYVGHIKNHLSLLSTSATALTVLHSTMPGRTPKTPIQTPPKMRLSTAEMDVDVDKDGGLSPAKRETVPIDAG